MQTPTRLALLIRLAACAVVALGVATPAAAQFGGLKKKLKAAAGSETAAQGQKAAGSEAAPSSTPAAPQATGGGKAGGGAVVLTADVVDHLVAGLKAAKATRLAAQKEDTPNGRYDQAVIAYDAAKAKCQAAQQTFPTRMAANQKLADQYSALVDKMMSSQGKGELTQVYSDSALAMQDPSCVVKQPTQPDDYYEAQRAVDTRAEQDAVKASGLSAAEYSMALERAEGILRGAPPSDASASETSAVNARAADLKPLLGIQDAPVARTRKSAPAAAPAPAPEAATPAPAASAGNNAVGMCMSQNAQKHQKEIEALGQRAQAAQQAGNTAAMMAIADTLQQIQMAGCMGAK